MPIVLSEWSNQLAPSPSARDLGRLTEAARLLGWRVHPLPVEFTADVGPEQALAYVRPADTHPDGVACPAVWVGYLPSPERYAAVYAAAERKHVRLVNTPQQHQRATEFDASYPALRDMTPESVVIRSLGELARVREQLGFPVFLKGAVKSQKEGGWRACVAVNEEELSRIASALLRRAGGSRGRIVARKLVALRHTRTSPQGFPLGREFRVFLYRQRVLASGYYWEGQDPLSQLTSSEAHEVAQVAQRAAERLQVPYLCVDLGQLTSGAWTIIEVGDGQFCGLSQVSPLGLWQALQAALEAEGAGAAAAPAENPEGPTAP